MVIASFTVGKIKSSPILCGLPDLAINKEIFYDAQSPPSSCLEATKNSFDTVG
jgi:hypothetical protein